MRVWGPRKDHCQPTDNMYLQATSFPDRANVFGLCYEMRILLENERPAVSTDTKLGSMFTFSLNRYFMVKRKLQKANYI